MHVLVTGGAGYIGSHTVLQLLNEGHRVSVLDNFSNSSPESIRRVMGLSNLSVDVYRVDLLDEKLVNNTLTSVKPDAVIHFAGLKAVGESVTEPLKYYRNNVTGTLNLLDGMEVAGCRTLVFSSSATVYGESIALPLVEETPRSATNPYGRTKLHIEEMLEELGASDSRWSIANLRYFNPVGAHESGQIGEDPQGVPNNLMPYVAQVAIGRRDKVSVYGGDYQTPDGTGVRDYIHVEDLAAGHLAALDYLQTTTGVHVWNLGTGAGSSVLEVIEAFKRVSGQPVPFEIVARRTGDVAESYANAEKARLELGWKAERGLEQMVQDMWRWQKDNPMGFEADHLLELSDEELAAYLQQR
ncbi:UDP-glucose 4-epimerase GalE [Glutamicibacter sp. JC586]|uniref:UDP-glucose 4-epimerase GalE n=1 Tax=Glutamicibacter sp. JC586 TaxID=2590552 RepID=UPI00135BEC23|nr:UDP-glucose 4-epimerase GalE [Glutamicibacter sp. JC586]